MPLTWALERMRAMALSSAVTRRECLTGRGTTDTSGCSPMGRPSFLPSTTTGRPFHPPLSHNKITATHQRWRKMKLISRADQEHVM